MVKTLSRMIELGFEAPTFSLPDCNGTQISLDEHNQGRPLLVMFICNHCPYVKHIVSTLSRISKEIQELGIDVIAINSNDILNFPEDSPEKMRDFAKLHAFKFPYLFDESQEIAKAYRAACTPDIFLFNKNRKLFYRGQLDGSRPENEIISDGKDLIKAVSRLVKDLPPPENQKPSIGCNIKWKIED